VDRVGRAGTVLATALVAIATWAILGAQGARLGPLAVPALSPWWVVAAAALVLLLTPQKRSGGAGGGNARALAGAPIEGVLLLLSLVVLLTWRHEALHPKAPLDFVVNRGGAPRRGSSLQLERRSELRRLTGLRYDVELETGGILEVPRSGLYRFDLSCDDSCELELGTHVLRAHGEHRESLELEAGDVPFSLRYRQGAGPARLVVRWTTPALVELLPIDYYLRPVGGEPRKRVSGTLALASLVLWFGGFSLYLSKLGRARRAWIGKRVVPITLASLVMVYGTALRFEALLAHSGLARQSEGAAAIHEALSSLLPSYSLFNPENAPDDPYRADVRSYLDRAESIGIGTFYGPSFREPFYPLLVRAFVSVVGSELGILVESFFFSVLTLPLFYLVARHSYGDWWAAALLVPVSLHEWLVLEAPTGYRESAYAFFLLAFVALMAAVAPGKASRAAAAAAAAGGALGGLVCLIRLSALSVVAPIAMVRTMSLPRPRPSIPLVIFAAALTTVVAPFLVSNYRAHDDPFYSVSFHTEFWLRAEGIGAGEGPVSLSRYFTDFGRTGRLVKGTLLGLTILPLRTFWNGLRLFPALGVPTLALGVAGLVLAARRRAPFLPAAYLGHLLPFAYIQTFPSGEMPRFVMPAFFYLVLAIPIAATALRGRIGHARGGEPVDPPVHDTLRRVDSLGG
jgi:hypothetical protein